MNAYGFALLGALTVKKALDDDLEEEIAAVVQLPMAAVSARLWAAHGRTLLQTLFAKEWPSEAARLGALTVAQLQRHDMTGRLAWLMKKNLQLMQVRMFAARNTTLIRDVFGDDWPALREPIPTDEEWERQRLEDLQARHALEPQTIGRIAKVLGLRKQTVKDRLHAAHGQKLVRNVFAEEWTGRRRIEASPTRRIASSAPPQDLDHERLASEPSQVLFSWLHISDLHFGHGDAEHGWDQNLVLRELHRSVITLAHTRAVPRPDAILVTGDIAFSGGMGRTKEYQTAKDYLTALATELQLSPRNVYLVPGNHDVQRRVDHNPMAAALVQAARSGDTLPFDTLLDNDDARAQLASRQTNYLTFANSFGPRMQEPHGRPVHWRHRLHSRGLDVVLLGLNTALLAADEHDHGRLRIGKRALSELLSGLHPDSETLVVALSHHPFDRGWLADEDEVNGWLARYAHIHLSGHIHEAQSEDSRLGGSTGRLVRVRAGAAHGEKHTGAPAGHGYNLAAVLRHPDGTLVLRTWPRRWSKTKRDFCLDIDHAESEKRPYAEHPLRLIWRSAPTVSEHR